MYEPARTEQQTQWAMGEKREGEIENSHRISMYTRDLSAPPDPRAKGLKGENFWN